MLEINLLPPELKKNSKVFFEIPKVKLVPILIWAAAVLLILEVMIGGFAFIQKRRIDGLVSSWQGLMPLKKKADFLREDTRALEAKVSSFDRLAVRRFEWARKLNGLSDSITQGVWLTSLSIEKKDAELNRAPLNSQMPQKPRQKRWLLLNGRAVSLRGDETELVAKFIKSLKGNEAFFESFDDIELTSSKRESMGAVEVMGFTLKCYFKDNVEF